MRIDDRSGMERQSRDVAVPTLCLNPQVLQMSGYDLLRTGRSLIFRLGRAVDGEGGRWSRARHGSASQGMLWGGAVGVDEKGRLLDQGPRTNKLHLFTNQGAGQWKAWWSATLSKLDEMPVKRRDECGC